MSILKNIIHNQGLTGQRSQILDRSQIWPTHFLFLGPQFLAYLRKQKSLTTFLGLHFDNIDRNENNFSYLAFYVGLL
ncbi:MAG: hypothetical protein QE271_14625, partial [Bacteriovoracaceae bacterium]|nr:hypothetical protein [Bacteriovoracaceae bacterium]